MSIQLEAIEYYLASEQVHGLDPGGAFVQCGNSRVAINLFHSVLCDIAVSTKNLHAVTGALIAHLSQKGFQNRCHKTKVIFCRGFFFLGITVNHQVCKFRCVVEHCPAALGDGLLSHEKASYVRVMNNGITRFVRVFMTG